MKQAGEVTRRRFLGTSFGAASAALITPTLLRAAEEKAQPKPVEADDLRCGMIGIGGRGSGVLAAVHQSPRVRITALCDINKDNLNRAAESVKEDKPTLFDDYRKMLEFKDLDAVFVETPCYLHKEMVVAALQAGKHCYGEKPMAITLPDLDEMVKVVEQTKKVYQVGTQLRYAAPWNSAVRAIHEGKIGKPILIRAHRHNAGDLPHDIPWFFDSKRSGDTILEQAVHEFDIMNWIFQGVPERASGFGGQDLLTEPKGRNIMDNYTLSLDYGKGRRVSYSHSWISSPNIPCDGRQEIVYGATGAVDVEGGMIYGKDGSKAAVDPEPKGDSTQLAVDDFFRCIREGKKPLADVHAGRNGVLVAMLGLKAIKEGRVVTMKELLGQA